MLRNKTWVSFATLGFVISIMAILCSTLLISHFLWLPWLMASWLIIKGFRSKQILQSVSFLGGVCIPYIAIILLLFGRPALEPIFRVDFNSTKWKQAEQKDESIRIRMVDDLLSQHNLTGKSRSEIDSLLGTPEKTNYFQDYDYVYWLGPQRGLIPIDSEWLVIKFKNNIVVDARIVMD